LITRADFLPPTTELSRRLRCSMWKRINHRFINRFQKILNKPWLPSGALCNDLVAIFFRIDFSARLSFNGYF